MHGLSLDHVFGKKKKKNYNGHYWNNWGNLNMDCILGNVFVSASDFSGVIILWFVGECPCSKEKHVEAKLK